MGKQIIKRNAQRKFPWIVRQYLAAKAFRAAYTKRQKNKSQLKRDAIKESRQGYCDVTAKDKRQAKPLGPPPRKLLKKRD